MKDPTKFNCAYSPISIRGNLQQLSDRHEALEMAAECFKIIAKPVRQTTRSDREIPVFSAPFGVGKTRMMLEWERMFDLAGIPKTRFGVYLPLLYGHRPTAVERKMTIETSIAWRLLHQCFIEDNGECFREWFIRSLPVNGCGLRLDSALSVIRLKCIERGIIKQDDTLHMFIGIDHFHHVHGDYAEKIWNKELLQDLLDLLGGIMASPVNGVRIYPMFAGKKFSVMSITSVFRTGVKLIPISYLTPPDVENALSTVPDADKLLSLAKVRRHLFYIGRVPGWCWEFIYFHLDKIEKVLPDDYQAKKIIEENFQQLRNQRRNRWERMMRRSDVINSAAFAISGQPVADESAIIFDQKWSEIRDTSWCLFNSDNQIMLPYLFLQMIHLHDGYSQESKAVECFISCIQGLVEHVDNLMFDKAPWEFLVLFGAYFHALRINALLILYGNTSVPLRLLFRGALINGCDEVVVLKPMLVVESKDRFSVDMKQKVECKRYNNPQYDWLNDGYVFVNGEQGKGVDIFFALKKKSTDGFVVVTDQRNPPKDNNSGPTTVSDLLQMARIRPDILGTNSTVVPCLFSCVTNANISEADLDENSVVVSYRENKKYHCTFATHPAAFPFLRINADPVTYIEMLLQGNDKRELAQAIISRRQTSKFTSTDELRDFIDVQMFEATLINDFELRVSLN